MIKHTLDIENGILYVQVESSLEKADFERLAEVADPYIERSGGFRGLIIETRRFPGWESFGAMITHFRFVRDHHKTIQKVGLVTDSSIGDIAERLGSHFVAAKIKHFPEGDFEAAKEWVML